MARPPGPKRLVVAIGLLTEQDILQLGEGFDRWFPVEDTPCLGELQTAIDEADRRVRQERSVPDTPVETMRD